MSNPGDTDLGISSLSADVGWRGKRKSRQLAVSRGWQQGAQPQPLTQVTSQNRRRRVQIAVSFCALLVLFGLWLYMLLFTAVQTPVVAVTATEYDWPLPPNAWAREDLLGLNDLQRRTLRVEEASADWTSRDHALRDFERKVQAQARRQSGLSTLIIFVSMHGLVNDADEPCLVPPGASPVDQSSWLPVRELLDRIKEQAPSEQLTKLLILDCNRIPVNWHVGILENQFADKLAKAVEDASVPRLIVLNSTSPGQTGWASSDLHGSVFGHYLRQALAGEADADGNHRISVGELQAYLRRHVNQWALANRAERQEPMLLAKDELRRHEVVWVAQGKLPPPEAVDPQVTAEDLRQLWLDHDALHDLQPERFAPLAWSALEHRLLWLEQLRDGGRAYGEKAVDVRDDLRRRIATIKKRAEAASGLGSAARSRIWSADDDRAPERGQLHTLPLAEFFGTTDRVVNSKIRDQWNRFQKTPEAGILSDAIAQLDRLAADYRAPALAESSFLRTIQRFALPPQSSPSAARLACVSSVWATVQQGEQAAVPDDERAGSWIRPLVDDGDRHRRAAEDALLDGDDQQLSAEVRLAEEKYTKAQLLAKLVSDAFQLHDEVRLQLPYLAQWLTRPVPLGLASATADREIKERLPRLIDNVHRLSKQLARHDLAGTLEASESAPFAKAESDVRQDFDALGQAFRTNCESLEKGREIAPHQLREVAAVLATPLVDAAQRTKLQRKLADLDLRLNQTTAARVAPEGLHPPSAAEGSKTGETPSVEEARFRYGTASHPALELLRSDWLDEPSAAAPRAAEPKGQDGGAGESTETGGPGGTPVRAVGKRLPLVTDVKRRLQQRLAQLAPLVDSLAVAADANGPVASALEAAWLRRSRAERLVRAASSIWCPPFDSDPVAELRRFDWQQQLLWQCRRTLEDFRGPAARGEEPFFSVAAADYLSPSRLFQAADPVIGQQREALAESLATLRTAARRGLAVAAENVLLIDPADAWQSKVIVTPGAGLAASDLPRGRMAFMVLSGARRVEGVALVSRTPAAKAGDSSMTLLFPLPARQELELQGRAVTQQEPGLLAAAVFRGHEFATPFLVQTLGGLSVDYVPGAEQPPRVTLKGIRRPRKSIVFVLDCSESMKEEVPVEATEGQKVPRLEIAKSALQGMLEQLAAQGEARVGVRLFGHRVGWSTTEPIRVLRQTTYVRPIPPGLSPAEDVELILPLGRFDSVLAGQVAELLKTVKPWGQTPLYRSLVETQRDFDSDEAGTDKHVVVISDGANYQFTLAASGQFAAPHPTELADVVAAWGKHQPAIHIVGFGIPEAERVDAERAFRQLVDRTKGSYETSAVEAQALLGKLDELLAKSTYTIRNAAGQDVGAAIEQNGSISPRRGPVRLGEPLVVSPVLRGPQSYTLSCQVASVPLRLRGGEHAELVLSDDGRRVENVTYLEGSPKFGRLLNGRLGAPTGLLVGVHRPLAERDGLRFTLSLQHENRRFVPRPAEVWIEITPLLADGSTVAPYCFYDAEFAPSAPVPALSWVANGWPDNGSQAAVRFWCKDEATPPEVTIPLSKIPAAPADRQQFPAFPGVRLQLETVQQNEVFGVRVVEWHEPESEGVGSLKVELARPLEGKLRPQRVLHLLDTEHRVAAHLFLFTTWDPQAASSFEIRLTKAASVKDEAQQLDQSLEVSLTENVELIAPGIPTTPR